MTAKKGALDRRKFLKTATVGAGAVLAATPEIGASEGGTPKAGSLVSGPWVRTKRVADVAVVGAGAFGAWTALHLQESGAQVTLIDQYGPANSRSTSGGETRGVRTGYGDRAHGLLWTRWAKRALGKWKAWDERWQDMLLPRVYFETSDLIMRDEWTEFMEDTKKNWDAAGVGYEILEVDEVRRRWPVIGVDDITVALHELDAGVVRARHS